MKIDPFVCSAFLTKFGIGLARMPILSKGGAPTEPDTAYILEILEIERQVTFQSWGAEA